MALDPIDNGYSGDTFASSGFLGSLGVDTHLPYTDGGYDNIANVAADLAYLGLSNVRDGITNGQFGSASLSTYITLAHEGVKFIFSVAQGGAVTTASLQATLGLIDQVNEAVPGSVVGVEGANEINNLPISFNGETDDLTAAVELQQALYTAVHADQHLTGVPVLYFTGYYAYSIPDQQPIPAGPDPSTTPGLADYDNQHPYPAYGSAPDPTVTPSYALRNESASSGFSPSIYTETGYSTNGGTTGGVNEDVQAKYELDLLFDDAVNGISRTYLFQLLDAYQPDSSQGDDGYGLFGPDGAPKESANAIHNLTTILADPGAGSASVPLTTLTYSVANLPYTGNTLALEKSTGAYDVVVYNEPKIWDFTTGTELAAPAQTVTVELGATYGTVELFDPFVGTAALTTLHNVSSVQLSLTDHPLIVEIEPPCYCPGTLILTERGEVAVEALSVGDRVATAGGGLEAIRWIGWRSYAGAFIAGRHLALPVCIKAGALAAGVPHTDLWVSPGHAMFIDGQLVAAWRLINGVSVVQPGAVDTVTYIHVELARHDILVANGAAAESFLDDGWRNQFHNAATWQAHFAPMRPFAARLEDGFGLQRLQERVAARADVFLPPDVAGPLRGFVDHATPERVCGWAQDIDNTDEPVALEVLAGGVPVLCLLANGYRADLRKAGIGSGCHAFDIALDERLTGPVTVRRVTDGALLPHALPALRLAA